MVRRKRWRDHIHQLGARGGTRFWPVRLHQGGPSLRPDEYGHVRLLCRSRVCLEAFRDAHPERFVRFALQLYAYCYHQTI